MPDPAKVTRSDRLAELLVASGRGNRKAFARVYQLSASRLFPIALRILRHREAAEDVLQETFVLMWRKAAQFRPVRGGSFPWMVAIVLNCAIDQLREEARAPRGVSQWDESADEPRNPFHSTPALPDAMTATVRSCLERLQENQRKTILLAYYQGMMHEELAAHIDAPLGTVKSWVRRGLIQLRDCIYQ